MTGHSSDHQQEENAPIEVVPYDPSWPEKFAAERGVLEEILKPWIVGGIQHVGSTAVPGLDAKPVIDIMVGIESLESSRDAIPAAGTAGYIYWPYKADVMHWFCKPSAAHRTHHLHLVPLNSPLWKARIGFRDALRHDAALAAAYADLKHELAGKYRHDREAYTESKWPFVKQVLDSIGLGDAPGT